MLMTYTNLDARELQGYTIADFLVAIEADFQIRDDGFVVYQEPFFPVVELARSLHLWVTVTHGKAQSDFVFDSLSFEEPGAVTVTRGKSGWVFGSRFTPDVSSSVVEWPEVQRCVARFECMVRSDLAKLGIDDERVFQGSR